MRGRGAGRPHHRDQRRRDRRRPAQRAARARSPRSARQPTPLGACRAGASAGVDRFSEAFRMALARHARAQAAHLPHHARHHHRHRLGGLGRGARRGHAAGRCSTNISAIGTNTIDIYPGTGFGDRAPAAIRTLRAGRRRRASPQQPYVDSVTPTRLDQRHAALRQRRGQRAGQRRRRPATSACSGIEASRRAQFFDADSVDRMRAGRRDRRQHRATRCSPNGENPIGQVILRRQGAGAGHRRRRGSTSGFGAGSQPQHLDALHHRDGPHARPGTICAASPCASPTTRRHGRGAGRHHRPADRSATARKDFFLLNTDEIRDTIAVDHRRR